MFIYQDFEIVLDKVKKLGDFIDIELQGRFRNRKKHLRRIIALLDKLGIRKNQHCCYGGYVEMMTGTSAKDWKE